MIYYKIGPWGVFILLLLTSCIVEKDSITVDSLCEIPPTNIINMSDIDLEDWVIEKYHINPKIEQRNIDNRNEVIYSWESGHRNAAGLTRDGLLYKIEYSDFSKFPKRYTFSEIIEQLGPPEIINYSYSVYEDIQYYINLNYPKSGISLATLDIKPTKELTLDEGVGLVVTGNLYVVFIDCYTPQDTMLDVWKKDFKTPPNVIHQWEKYTFLWEGFGQKVIFYK